MTPLNNPGDPVLYFEHTTPSGHIVAHARLNVESTLNSLSLEMIDSISPMLDSWAKREDIVALVFDGSGDKAFCAGGDIQALYHAIKSNQDAGNIVNKYPFEFFEREYRLDFKIHTFPKPVIAIGHGVVMGGGLGIMSGADYRVVTERSRIAMPEVTIGLFPDAGQTWSLRNMPSHYAVFLGMTGSHINATDSLEVGLATHSIKSESRDAFLEKLVGNDFSKDADLAITASLTAFPEADLPTGQIQVIPEQLTFKGGIAEVVSAVRNLRGISDWVDRGIDTMEQGCPTTIGIVLEQLQRAPSMTLSEVFQMEMIIGTHCANNTDFAEGVRALLIEKDNNPKWKYANIDSLPKSYVEEHFSDPWIGGANPLSDLGG